MRHGGRSLAPVGATLPALAPVVVVVVGMILAGAVARADGVAAHRTLRNALSELEEEGSTPMPTPTLTLTLTPTLTPLATPTEPSGPGPTDEPVSPGSEPTQTTVVSDSFTGEISVTETESVSWTSSSEASMSSESGKPDPGPSEPQAVFFEGDGTVAVDDVMGDIATLMGWDLSENIMSDGLARTPWLLITFSSRTYAAEAYDAANSGKLLGVIRAVYAFPVPKEVKKVSPFVVAIVILILVIVALTIFIVVMSCLCFGKRRMRNKKRRERFDEDYAMNYTTEATGLNNLLLVDASDAFGSDIVSDLGGNYAYGAKSVNESHFIR